MQVYVALFDQDNDFLVVQKREFNDRWKSKQGNSLSLGNQAGQYAFPGGKAVGNTPSALYNEARREFVEETGLEFPMGARLVQTYKKGNSYCLFVVHVPRLTTIARDIRSGAACEAGSSGPTNKKIEDWELADAHMVPLLQLRSYLGCRRTAISIMAKNEISTLGSDNYTQSIDWYAEMATALMKNLSSSATMVNL